MLCADGCRSRRTEIVLEAAEETDDTEETSVSEDPEQDTGQSAQPDAEVSTVPDAVFVDVCGAVTSPGVYELETDSRVFQAIEAAGGFLPDAASAVVNQAQPVSDGQQIYVPTQEEAEAGINSAGNVSVQPGSQETADSANGVVNINTADAETLKTLSGIGDAKAQAILSYREEHGAFASAEDIMQVPGIKESTFLAIKDKIAVK